MMIMPVYAPNRAAEWKRPTHPASGSRTVVATAVADGSPTEKVKAPATGWLSADST